MPMASLRTAEKQRDFSPSEHREVGHRLASRGVIPFATLERA